MPSAETAFIAGLLLSFVTIGGFMAAKKWSWPTLIASVVLLQTLRGLAEMLLQAAGRPK